MRVFHARLHVSSGKNTALKRCPSCPFVLNGLVLTLLTLKSPFWPVLWPFCPVLCPFWTSHKLLTFTGTVYDTKFMKIWKGISNLSISTCIHGVVQKYLLLRVDDLISAPNFSLFSKAESSDRNLTDIFINQWGNISLKSPPSSFHAISDPSSISL